MLMKKVLFVITSHADLGDTGLKTGFWTEELAAPYYALQDQGVAITLCSPKGGQPPVDPKSNQPEFQTDATRRMDQDAALRTQLAHTLQLSDVNVGDYDAVFYPGGHGPLWDLAQDAHSIQLIADFYAAGKPVAFVCHAPGALKNVRLPDGKYLVEGKNVTGFSNTEETAVQLTDIVPFLVEDMLKSNGAHYLKEADWTPYVVVDGLLITGQNPASSEAVANALCELILVTQPDHVQRVSPTLAKVHTEILIHAPAAKVWAVLRDFENMAAWSSSLKSVHGEIENGANVQVAFAFGPDVLTPTHHLIYQEGAFFGWSDPIDVMPGLYDNHLYQVQAVSATLTRFIQTDQFVGKNEQVHPGDLAQMVLPLYQAFNRELKARVAQAI